MCIKDNKSENRKKLIKITDAHKFISGKHIYLVDGMQAK